MTFFMSCRTIQKTVYYIPEVDWPDFPELGECEAKDGKVTTDENYFRRLLMFRTSYYNEIQKYEEKKMKVEEMNK